MSIARRIEKLEQLLGERECTCASRPPMAVSFEDPARWEHPSVTLDRAEEMAKLAFTCHAHGAVGPGVHVAIRSFSSSTCESWRP